MRIILSIARVVYEACTRYQHELLVCILFLESVFWHRPESTIGLYATEASENSIAEQMEVPDQKLTTLMIT